MRYQVSNGQVRRTELVDVDLGAALQESASANLTLQPFDTLTVKEVPEWQDRESVTLRGEVRFPGVYAIRRGETLKSVIGRAGGLSQYAFAEGSVFTRAELKRREQEQLDMLADRMQRDLALLALQGAAANQAGAATALSVGQSLLGQLKNAQAVGRLVIDVTRLERSPVGSIYDVILHDGDTLIVPRFQQQVTVIGEVQTATSHLYSPKLSRDDYIALSGGMTRHADGGRIYIVRASGTVVAAESGSRWFQHGGSVAIKPGDTIVVPLDTEHIPALPLWTQVTQILYNIAIARCWPSARSSAGRAAEQPRGVRKADEAGSCAKRCDCGRGSPGTQPGTEGDLGARRVFLPQRRHRTGGTAHFGPAALSARTQTARARAQGH